jgi:hypothetical protein
VKNVLLAALALYTLVGVFFMLDLNPILSWAPYARALNDFFSSHPAIADLYFWSVVTAIAIGAGLVDTRRQLA